MRGTLTAVRTRLRRLRFGFLAIPGLTVLVLTGLAFVFLALDRSSGEDGAGFGVADDPEAARTVLTTIAGSLVTVAGVTFSITVVTLQLVSQQFTPRALRGFLGDRLNQMVAGVFIGVFVFCLIALRTVQAEQSGGGTFVPALTVTVSILLAIVALALLLIFIDHISRKIQLSTIAADVARSTLGAVDRVYPAPYGRPAGDNPKELVRRWTTEREPEIVGCERPGYVQSVTVDNIPRKVGSPGLRIEMRVVPGDFVTEADDLAAYWPGEEDRSVAQALRYAVVIANERDLRQDPGYGLRQLADIAMKAISPGVNDPTTAWTCIRYMQSIMERLAGRGHPDSVRRYDDVGVTVVTHPVPFEDYVDVAYLQVGRYATDARVAGALLSSIERAIAAAEGCGATDRIQQLVAAAERVVITGREGGPPPHDAAAMDRAIERIRARARAEV